MRRGICEIKQQLINAEFHDVHHDQNMGKLIFMLKQDMRR